MLALILPPIPRCAVVFSDVLAAELNAAIERANAALQM
jgi:hypothetical protein